MKPHTVIRPFVAAIFCAALLTAADNPVWPENNGVIVIEAEAGGNPGGFPIVTAANINTLPNMENERWNKPAELYKGLLRDTWSTDVSGGTAVHLTQPGAVLRYHVEITTPGEWVLVLRHYAAHHMMNGIFLRWDGEVRDRKTKLLLSKRPHWQNRIITSKDKSQYSEEPAAPFLASIKPGHHILELASSRETPLLDKITLMTRKQFERQDAKTGVCQPKHDEMCIDWGLGPQ